MSPARIAPMLGAGLFGIFLASAAVPVHAAPLRFGLASAGLSYPFAAAVAKGFSDAAKQAGARAIVLDGRNDVQTQANDIDDLIAQKVDGIAIMPLDSVVAEGWVGRTAQAGIPAVALGAEIGDPRTRPVRDVDPRLVALATQDEVAAGAAAGRLALSLLPKNRAAKIAVVEGAAGFPEVLQRLQGFRQALDQGGIRYTIVASQPGGWTPEKAEDVCMNILAAHPDTDLFFNESDDMAVGCAHAVLLAQSPARLIGIGGSRLAIAAIKAGRLTGTVCYEPETLGALAFQALYEDETGRNTRRAAFLSYPTPGVTRADIARCTGQW
jgi:ribose transport system substrate-binding protein